MKIIHLWQDYSPSLFDRSHPLCMSHGADSEVVCQAYIKNGAVPLPNTYWVRMRSPDEAYSRHLLSRLVRFVRRKLDSNRFSTLAKKRMSMVKPDVVHIHFGTTAAVLAQHRALPSVPFLVSFYGADISQALHNKAFDIPYRIVLENASVLHVLCEEAKARLVSLGASPDKIRIGNLPIDLTSIPFIGIEPVGITRFLIPARFVEKKGHLVLLQAFRSLVDAGLPVTLTCFGYGPLQWLVRAIHAHKLDSLVRVVDNCQSGDFIAEYITQLRAHDVVLAPSVRAADGDDEGGPALTLVMAQAAGKPVIASDFPGCERSVTDGVEGRVVPSGDSKALFEAMLSLVGAVSEWRRFGDAGRIRVSQDFSDDAYWSQLKRWCIL